MTWLLNIERNMVSRLLFERRCAGCVPGRRRMHSRGVDVVAAPNTQASHGVSLTPLGRLSNHDEFLAQNPRIQCCALALNKARTVLSDHGRNTP